MHGFIDQGSTWFFNSRDQNLIFSLLKTRKHDLWIAHSRETILTKGHRYYTEYDKEYYDFTFYEMAT